MQDIKQQILSRLSLPALIGETVPLQKRGNFATGLCPFHEESTPSFYVYEDHYHCYGCGAHGDAISYVRQVQGLPFMDSLRWLADKAGVSLASSEEEKKYAQEWKKKARENQVLLAAKAFFSANLQDKPKGQSARAYLETRQLSQALTEDLGVGYALHATDALFQHLKGLGFSVAEMEACSLINQGRGQAYDFFQNRLILPIRDEQGRIIAFTGRALGDEMPKYKNSRFDKSSYLFGLDKARVAMRQKSRAIVVEGHFDVLQMWMHSFPETVACQGTALTREHLRKLGMLTHQIFLVFDGDAAGRKAALKVLDNAFAFSDIHFKVALLSPGEDPDSLLRKHGPTAMTETLEKAVDLLDFAITEKLRHAPQTGLPDLIAKSILPWLEQIPDPLRRAVYIQKISQQTGIGVQLLTPKVKGLIRSPSPTLITQPTKAKPDPTTLDSTDVLPQRSLEREFIGHLYFALAKHVHVQEIEDLIVHHLELQGVWLALVKEIWACLQNGENPKDKELTFWRVSGVPAVLSFLEEIRSRQKAFDNSGEISAFVFLRLEAKKKLLKETLESLKQQSIAIRVQKIDDPELWGLLTHSLVRTTQELESVDSLLRKTDLGLP